METPKPTLIVNGPAYSPIRQKAWQHHLTAILAITAEERALRNLILATHRRRQTRKLGKRDEDPDPYSSDYIFYCLQGRRET